MIRWCSQQSFCGFVVTLLLMVAAAQGDNVILQGSGSIWDALSSGGATNNDSTSTIIQMREYWDNPSSYDQRLFMKITLPKLGVGQKVTVTAATLELTYLDDNGVPNDSYLDIGYTTDEFTSSLNANTFDGTHPWSDGNLAGVDGYARKHFHHLAYADIPRTTATNTRINLSEDTLASYVQAQWNCGNALYLVGSISAVYAEYKRFYTTECTTPSYRPSLTITYTVQTITPTPHPTFRINDEHLFPMGWYSSAAEAVGTATDLNGKKNNAISYFNQQLSWGMNTILPSGAYKVINDTNTEYYGTCDNTTAQAILGGSRSDGDEADLSH